ncbi:MULTISPECIES: malate dehydrogenase (quinone) [unclassified Halomonas]|uniref:malate dehydrogenase (quinone) n=1 Tax=unclassified Halomonas TaxID=2609666 RepID=UPI0020A0C9AD|nr:MULTISPECIES: malate dehydrogenase (quinone) [unclassified Halomonas]MCP1314944.1 malate dehydrogenase (quinone) [Halomonas sp. 707D7]MCP1326198.1 malate dehydrogenase (quinone) [Halomonas sp. 707D4]
MVKRFRLLLCSPLLALASAPAFADEPVDVVLVGGGIMSATLGTYLHELEPEWNIQMFERLDVVASESSNAWNNSGSGHSAFMEMNYTPDDSGQVEIQRAVNVTEQFEVSRQFWAHQVANGVLNDPSSFINTVPHFSLVWGDEDVAFLRERFEKMTANPLYAGMEYSEDPEEIAEWMPLIMAGRDGSRPVAATRMQMGTEVNYGEQTRQMIASLEDNEHFTLSLESEVRGLDRNDDGTWRVTVTNLSSGDETSVDARYVFLGAGGAVLPLLQESGIAQASLYGGFPVGGQFLYTTNPEVVSQHPIKVYGKAGEGSPPMSVPHLDYRNLDGEPALFFGPFATFSSKFLKEGSWTDLFGSLSLDNTWPMMQVGFDNFSLVRYLMGQVVQSDNARFEALQDFYPEANRDDWQLWTAGQRVQIIKDTDDGGVLQFGTEVIVSDDGSMSALLGASPGASTSPTIMLSLLERVFAEQVASDAWQQTLTEILPSYGQHLADSPELLREVRSYTAHLLELDEPMNLLEEREASDVDEMNDGDDTATEIMDVSDESDEHDAVPVTDDADDA